MRAIFRPNRCINANHSKSRRAQTNKKDAKTDTARSSHTRSHATIDLRSRHVIHPRSTSFVPGKANECELWPRRYHWNPWSRGREMLAAASYALRQNVQRVLFCANGEESRVFVSSVFYAKRLAHPRHATCHRPGCEHCDVSAGSEP